MSGAYEITIPTAALIRMARAQGILPPALPGDEQLAYLPSQEGLTLTLDLDGDDGMPILRAIPPPFTEHTPATTPATGPTHPPRRPLTRSNPLPPPPPPPQTAGPRANSNTFPPPAEGRHHSKMLNIHYPPDAPTPLKVSISRAHFDDLPEDQPLTNNHRLLPLPKSILKKRKVDNRNVPHAGLWSNLHNVTGVDREPYVHVCHDPWPKAPNLRKRPLNGGDDTREEDVRDMSFPNRMFRRITTGCPKRPRSSGYSFAASRINKNAPRFCPSPPIIGRKRARTLEDDDESDTASQSPLPQPTPAGASPLYWEPEDLEGWRPAPPRPEFSGSQVIWGIICANTIGETNSAPKPTLRFAPLSLEVAHYTESRPRSDRECRAMSRQANPALQAAWVAKNEQEMVAVRANWRLGRRIAKFRHERVEFINRIIDAAETPLQIEAAELALEGLEDKCLNGELYKEAASLAHRATMESVAFFKRALDGGSLAAERASAPDYVPSSPTEDGDSPESSTASTLADDSPTTPNDPSSDTKAPEASGSPTLPKRPLKRSTTVANLGPSGGAGVPAFPKSIPEPPQKRPTVPQWSSSIAPVSPTQLSAQLEKYLDGLRPAERVAYFRSVEKEKRAAALPLASGSGSRAANSAGLSRRGSNIASSSRPHNNLQLSTSSTPPPSLPPLFPLHPTPLHQSTSAYKSSVVQGRQYRYQEHDEAFLANLPRDEGAHRGVDDPTWNWENDSDGGTSVAFDLDLRERDEAMKGVDARGGW